MTARTPLDRDRILDAAAAVADRSGLAGVSMRRVGAELGVEAMSLYHHVAGKDALLDGLAEWVFARIELPVVGEPWREQVVARSRSARAVLSAHPWALGLVESRATPGPATLRQHDAMLGTLRAGGFPVALAAHLFSAVDAYVFGFVVTEQSLPFDPASGAQEFAGTFELPADAFPHLAEMVREVVVGTGWSFVDEFSYGLDALLDEFERRLAATSGG